METGWLIEKVVGSTIVYWAGGAIGQFGFFTTGADRAVRFRREEDADSVRFRLLEEDRAWRSVEHAWVEKRHENQGDG